MIKTIAPCVSIVVVLGLIGCGGGSDTSGAVEPSTPMPNGQSGTVAPLDTQSQADVQNQDETLGQPESETLLTPDFLTEDQLGLFETLGLQMNFGDNPPNIEGTFRIDPRAIQASLVPGAADLVGNTVASQNVTFANQNSATRTLEVSLAEDGLDPAAFGEVVIVGSSVTGSGNSFTALFLTDVTFDGVLFEIAQGFSGVLTDSGIENIQQVSLVTDDGGDPDNFLNPTNTGDLHIDLDGVSERL